MNVVLCIVLQFSTYLKITHFLNYLEIVAQKVNTQGGKRKNLKY